MWLLAVNASSLICPTGGRWHESLRRSTALALEMELIAHEEEQLTRSGSENRKREESTVSTIYLVVCFCW